MRAVVRQLRRTLLLRAGNAQADGELLDAFLARRDESAFEALLCRHAPMVLGVCRRVLRHEQDAEDAFQATFLVLARKAASVRPRDMVGPWLYGVAHRTALKARAMGAKRRLKERRAGERPLARDPTAETSEELLTQLDAALARLPDRYRVPIILCELEGRSRKEVARQLQIPEGTLSSRLAYARKLLARRLAPCGAGVLALALAQETASARASARLLHETAQAALQVVAGESLKAGAVSAQVVALTEGVIKAMFLSKIKGLGAVSLAVLLVAGAVGLTYRPVAAQPVRPGGGPPTVGAVVDELEELRLEVAALRKGLEATRARVRALEDQMETLRVRQRPLTGGPGARGTGNTGAGGAPGRPEARMGGADRGGWRQIRWLTDLAEAQQQAGTAGGKLGPQDPTAVRHAEDPLADAENALKKLRQHPDDKQAADALERALKRLRARQGTDPQEQPLRWRYDGQGQKQPPKAGADPKEKN